MKRVTASEARKNWFRLLDEVANGEVLVVERKGRKLVLRRQDSAVEKIGHDLPDYRKLLRVPDADSADRWSWKWKGPGKELVPAEGDEA
jgi:hypothetical protein